MKKNGQRRLEQRESILRYLAACPRAADTVEGVASWWLARQRLHDTRQAIEEILEELVAEGLLGKVNVANNVIYKWPDGNKENNSSKR